MATAQEFGVIGLGRMGGGLARQALDKGMRVVGHTLGGADPELIERGLVDRGSLEALVANLSPPRAVFVYIHAGPPIDGVLDALVKLLEPGDVVVDGGNSYWGDSIRRAERLAEHGLHLVDLGTSGGVEGARTGACFMAGGHEPGVRRVEPILLSLAVPGGYVHAGPPGAGHFTKLVHNGIEFGMLQAIGEGVALMEAHRDPLPVARVLEAWRHGSVIRSWLVDLLAEAYAERGGMEEVPAHIEDTGEVNWLVGDALRMEVPIPVISQSVMQLFVSRDSRWSWAKAIALMRHGFGGHPLGPSGVIARERRTGRIADPPTPSQCSSAAGDRST